MLNIKTKGLLLNIVAHCKRIEEKIESVDKKIYDSNDDIKDIICFNLLQIGELVKGLENDFINIYQDIPWNKVKGLRNRIVHGYGSMDMDRVWLTAVEDIKPLRNYCEQILKDN